MAKQKQLKPHVDYLDECLSLLRQKVGESKEYLNDVRWQDLVSAEDRDKEFKFQANLLDKYVAWLSEYARLSGIIEKLNELEGTDEKETRKGSYRSAFAEMNKNGEFEDGD